MVGVQPAVAAEEDTAAAVAGSQQAGNQLGDSRFGDSHLLAGTH
jgi:hypothetical protein